MQICSKCKRYARDKVCAFCGGDAIDSLPREPGFARGKTRAALVFGAAALAASSGAACVVMVYGAPPEEHDASAFDSAEAGSDEPSETGAEDAPSDAGEDLAMSVDAAYGGPPIDSGSD